MLKNSCSSLPKSTKSLFPILQNTRFTLKIKGGGFGFSVFKPVGISVNGHKTILPSQNNPYPA